MNTVLIIGGNGFIGSHLTDRFVKLGWETRILDLYERRYGENPDNVKFIQGDLSQSYLVREALAGVNLVYHLAWASIHEVSNESPVTDIQTNLIPTLELIRTCQSTGVDRLVFTSSGGTVYGVPNELPMAEDHPTFPLSSYGITKLAVEKYLHMYQQLTDMDYFVIRPSVPYGPRQNPLGRQGAVAVFLYRIANGMPIQVYGDGSTTRDFFYISDLINALYTLRELDSPGPRIYNIGGEEEVSLSELISEIEIVVGKQALLEYMPSRPFDSHRILLDTSAARNYLNWQPEVPLKEGLTRTWAWMKENVPEAR